MHHSQVSPPNLDQYLNRHRVAISTDGPQRLSPVCLSEREPHPPQLLNRLDLMAYVADRLAPPHTHDNSPVTRRRREGGGRWRGFGPEGPAPSLPPMVRNRGQGFLPY